ncbi:aldo/keto reductase [Candidatus Nomurabacteria bacterium]|nr:aldo/keto reductase [Candidatus Nomurabacteria bacterium]
MTLGKNKLVLGTAQLGMNYGLHNSHGQPSKEESFSILDRAFSVHINTFDTAHSYGASEDVIGAWVQDRSMANRVKLISKMKPDAINDYPDGIKFVDVVRRELDKSLARLQVETLDGYLFHSPHYIYFDHMMDGLQKVQDAGLVKNIGVSVYNELDALRAVELGVNYVQVPYNVFDQRLHRTDFFDIAKNNKITIFARSPFLQGLLLMQPSELPGHLSYFSSHLEQFIALTKRYNLTQVECALRFVDVMCPAEHIVFGVDTLTQLDEGVRVMGATTSGADDEWVIEARDIFKDLNSGMINPSLWGKIKR